MIDNLTQVYLLLSRLKEALPLTAHVSPELADTLRGNHGDVPAMCEVTRVDYTGDEGGIMCKLDFDGELAEQVFYVSITHLRFIGRSPLTRDIAAYQKHRLKRMRRMSAMA